MGKLGIFDLYEKEKEDRVKEFAEKTNSSLRVQTEYEESENHTEWIDIIEETISYIDNIFRAPNRFIINEEEIVKIELARKITVDSIKHLSKNTNFIQEYDEETNDIKPSKILNVNKEESYDTYENRFIYTLIQNMKFFISKKKKMIEENENAVGKNNKQIEYTGNSELLGEKIDIGIQLKTSLQQESTKEDLLSRILKLESKIRDIANLDTYKIIDKKHITLITPPIKKTNVILKNTNFQYAVKLWNFLQDNLDSKSDGNTEHQDYMDNEQLKNLVDETFLLNYLAINTIGKDKMENEEEEEKAIKQATDQMIEKIVELNSNLGEEDIKELIGSKYTVIKYMNVATISELQKIFKKHIDKYLSKIK